MSAPRTVYDRKHHAAAHTSEYLFSQLIPYIGNKRKLLGLIHRAIQRTGAGGYERTIERLNRLPPVVGWVAEHLCPRDDENYDVSRDRMFYMRKNGMRIDAVREHRRHDPAGVTSTGDASRSRCRAISAIESVRSDSRRSR